MASRRTSQVFLMESNSDRAIACPRLLLPPVNSNGARQSKTGRKSSPERGSYLPDVGEYDSILPGPLPMSAPTVMPAQVFELISKTNR